MPDDVYCYEGEMLAADLEIKKLDDLMRRGWDLAIARVCAELRALDHHEAVKKISALKYDER